MLGSKAYVILAVIIAFQSGCVATSLQENSSGIRTGEPRVKPIPVEDMNAQQKKLLGIVDGKPLPKRAKSNLFGTLMHHSDLMAVYLPLGDAVNKAPQIPNKERELVILRVAWLYQGKYEWSQHYDKALAAGWTDEEINRIKRGSEAQGWSETGRTLIKAADQLVQNAFLENEVWAALREQYSVQDIMVLITLVTHYHWVAMMTNSLGIEPERPVQGFAR